MFTLRENKVNVFDVDLIIFIIDIVELFRPEKSSMKVSPNPFQSCPPLKLTFFLGSLSQIFLTSNLGCLFKVRAVFRRTGREKPRERGFSF